MQPFITAETLLLCIIGTTKLSLTILTPKLLGNNVFGEYQFIADLSRYPVSVAQVLTIHAVLLLTQG